MDGKTSGGRNKLILLCVLVVVATGLLVGLEFLSRRYPPQPKFGYTGDWRRHSVFGEEERPLPPAARIREDYENWVPRTNRDAAKYYIARLGQADRQSNFKSWTNRYGTPQAIKDTFTWVEFTYEDPTNGAYELYWGLTGEHDVRFLRFDDTERLYQLRLGPTKEGQPPSLMIKGIEGIKPPH